MERAKKDSKTETGILKKKAIQVLLVGLVVFFVSQSTVTGMDPPHNEASGVSCSDCHGVSLLDYQSPFWTDNTADTVYNSLCTRCHDVLNPDPYHATNAPQANAHAPGGASFKCVACHDNHDQDQIYLGKSNKSEFFIATVTGVGASYNSNDNTTNITYNPGTWSGIGDWADPDKLDEKTSTGRGAQLVPDCNSRKRWPIYIIKSINTGTNTITVKGNVTAASNIGIFYGMLIKKLINGKTVKLWNNVDSNSFTDTTGNGICQVCHTSTEYYRSDGSRANHNSGANCCTCHQHSNITTGGFAVAGPDHLDDGLVNYPTVASTDDCDLCHAGDVISGADTHESQCALCHVDPGSGNYILIDPAASTRVSAMPDGGTLGGIDGGGTCGECHGDHRLDWYFHDVDHLATGMGVIEANTSSTPNTVNCVGCHDQADMVRGIHDSIPTTVGGTQACTECHTPAGALRSPSAADNFASVTIPAECNECHPAYFDGHDHGFAGGSYSHDIIHNDLTDLSQLDSQPCRNCHDGGNADGNGIALNSWADINGEHDVTTNGSGPCTTCHNSTRTLGVDTGKAYSDVQDVINTGTSVVCLDCHFDKKATASHGGHEYNHFSWDGNCVDCHATFNNYIVQEVHSNSCIICHALDNGSRDNEKLGDVAYGIDGDARLANGTAAAETWTAPACSTCHPPGTYDVSTVHHTSASGYAAGGSCDQCHPDNSFYAGDHTSVVTLAVNCAACHFGTQANAGMTYNIPVGTSDNKIHDSCLVCHNADSDATLRIAYGSAQAMPDGGGDCEACHGQYFSSHTSIDHSASVDFAAGSTSDIDCVDCHSGTQGSSTSVPLDPADDMVHDSCSTCHATIGELTGAGGHAQAMPDGGEAGGTNGGGFCEACHNTYFDSHTHVHALVYDDSVDISQTGGTANECADCHDDAGNFLADFDDIRYEHDVIDSTQDASGGCSTCHDYITNGEQTGDPDTPLLATVRSVIAAGGTVKCVDCHVPKSYADSPSTAEHGTCDHEGLGYVMDSETQPGCQSCHMGDAALGVHDGCSSCHTTIPDLKAGPSTDYTMSIMAGDADMTTGNCEDCHNAHEIVEEAGVDVAQHPPQMCGECHGGIDRHFSDFSEIKYHHYNLCQTCHEAGATTTAYNLIYNSVPALYDGVPNKVNCIECHGMRPDHTGHPNVKAGVRGSKYSDDAVSQQTLSCFKAGCHAANTAEEHLTPRGVAYKNFETKYGQPFVCEMCHENKFPIDVVKAGVGCSDPAYTDQTSCEGATPRWIATTVECSDPNYTDQTSCEAGTPVWAALVYNTDPVINTAIANGVAGNSVYCSDCHKEDTTRHDFGECSDNLTENEAECIYECSDPAYATQVNCLANGETWDVSTGETWTSAGFCNDIRFDSQAACESGSTPVWYTATEACSDPRYTDQTSCENAVTTPIWSLVMPYSIHDKYNGVGIYSFSEKHHQGEIWNGTCSNGGITDEDACYADGSTWTPTYSEGETYVGNGDCTACHLDPREELGVPAPKILPCKECHVDNDVGGNQFTVYRDRAYTQDTLSATGYTGWSWSFAGDISNTVPADLSGVPHQWDVNGGEIQNYGVCVFCHKMRPYHAKTDPATSGITFNTDSNGTDTDCSDGACDMEHFPGVGRNGFDALFGIFRAPVKYYKTIGAAAPASSTTKKNLVNVPVVDGVPKVHPIYWQKVTYDPQTDPHGQVPGDHILGTPEYFIIPVYDTPSGAGADSVSISTNIANSYYTQATPSLTVQATCTGTCAEVILVWGGNQYSMGTGPNTYTKTLTSAQGVPDTYPSGLPGAGVGNSPDTALGRVYVISVDANGNTTDQTAVDFKKNNVITTVTYP